MIKKYVLLFGGELYNKGAQAMTFVTIDEITKRFPDHECVLISTSDYRRDHNEKEQYRFSIQPYPRIREWMLVSISKKVKALGMFFSKRSQLLNILINSDIVVDISGYALGSDWGCDSSINYCLRIQFAKMCGVKIYLMPQSFGPFDFKGKKAALAINMIRKCLPCAERIMAREEEGYTLLRSHFGLTNVVRSFDIVLQNKKIDIANIFRTQPVLDVPEIKKGAVGVIPNKKTIKFGGEDKVFSMYDSIVEILKHHHKKIYFLIHSVEDWDLCQTLYERYRKGYEDTYFLDRDLSCLEFDRTVNQFDFIIASRYHSVVHAYRNTVPAIVLGWAVKYKELMGLFKQENYQFNVRENIDLVRLKAALEDMTTQYETEKKWIGQGLEEIRKENAFDYIT